MRLILSLLILSFVLGGIVLLHQYISEDRTFVEGDIAVQQPPAKRASIQGSNKVSIVTPIIENEQKRSFQRVKEYFSKADQAIDNKVTTTGCDLECLYNFKAQLFDAASNSKERISLIKAISSSGSKEAMQVLLETLVLAEDMDDLEILYDINASLSKSDSVESLTLLLEVLMESQDTEIAYKFLPSSTKDLIIKLIDNVKRRDIFVPVLAQAYMQNKDSFGDLFIQVDYPEIYALVAIEADKVGNQGLKQVALEQVLKSSSDNSFKALTIYAEKNTSPYALDEAYKKAKKWSLRFLSPKVAELAESYLHSFDSTTSEKVVAVGVLSNMDDRKRKMALLNKVRQYSEDETVNMYIDDYVTDELGYLSLLNE